MAAAGRRLANGLDMADLGARIRLERARRRVSLETLARRSGVSRSMLSAVERGGKVPSVLVLDRIATALGTSIARLPGDERAARVAPRRRDEQDVARDPSGWERRILSPVPPGGEFEFMRTVIGPGVDAGALAPPAPGSREYVAVERGTLLLTIDVTPHTPGAEGSIYYAGDCVHAFANPGDKPLVYYLAMDVADGASGSGRHRPESPAPEGEGGRDGD